MAGTRLFLALSHSISGRLFVFASLCALRVVTLLVEALRVHTPTS